MIFICNMNDLPEAATSATGFCCSWAINPTTENMTTPLNILVQEFMVHTNKASLFNKKNCNKNAKTVSHECFFDCSAELSFFI